MARKQEPQHAQHDVEMLEEENDFDLNEDTEEPPHKKPRRSAKPNADKKFECSHEGCGKSYSRAEHLYRHQLNHTPKQIYRCNYPDCNRCFVRQDLCARHQERHTTHGSQLHKRDNFSQSASTQDSLASGPDPHVSLYPSDHPGLVLVGSNPARAEYVLQRNNSETMKKPQSSSHDLLDSRLSGSTASTESRFQPPTPTTSARSSQAFHRANSSASNPFSPDHKPIAMVWEQSASHEPYPMNTPTQQMGAFQSRDPEVHLSKSTLNTSPTRSYSMSSNSTHTAPVRAHATRMNGQPMTLNGYMAQQGIRASDQPHGFDQNEAPNSSAMYASAVTHDLHPVDTDPFPFTTIPNDLSTLDISSAYGYHVLGNDDYYRTPHAITDDFTAWLFNDNQSAASSLPSATGPLSNYNNDAITLQMHTQMQPFSPSSASLNPEELSMQHSAHVGKMLDTNASTAYIMSEEKRLELLELMQRQFIERPHDAVKKRKESVFEGDINANSHILSLRMMETYIGSYWYHQHAQLPILHKPSFSADKTQTLLLLAVIAIGAATLDKAYGTSLTDSAAEFANFVAWHIRWEIMRDADFRPPARLWVFQTLLLIEVYEKMYATRALHERGHIHHDSTLTLMRRGSSLTGKVSSDTPPNGREGEVVQTSAASSITSDPHSKEEPWNRWIHTEASRRAAFGALVIDSIHATMFGHHAGMLAHELRLPLPCDEGLWSAESAQEVQRLQSALQANGVRPIFFLEGLKKTLNGQRVRTNSFGRTILMAGLLSVSWHMAQRDLSVTHLSTQATQFFGGKDRWRSGLLRAYDNWKRDFDEALAEVAPASPDHYRLQSGSMLRPIDSENIFESRTVLHHLAHMAAHVDILDCQIYAGANRLLGRITTPRDYNNVREKINLWATKPTARDAAFYALKFLAQVLIPPYYDSEGRYGHATPILPLAFEQNQYIARDDFLLNRPWVLYYSALVAWCYGFALEGPIVPTPAEQDFATYEQKDKDMRDYLDRVGGIAKPDDLEHVRDKNRCLGLLLILKESFASTRWELTHEAANLLGNCIVKLKGGELPKTPNVHVLGPAESGHRL